MHRLSILSALSLIAGCDGSSQWDAHVDKGGGSINAVQKGQASIELTPDYATTFFSDGGFVSCAIDDDGRYSRTAIKAFSKNPHNLSGAWDTDGDYLIDRIKTNGGTVLVGQVNKKANGTLVISYNPVDSSGQPSESIGND